MVHSQHMKELLNLIQTTFANVPYPGDSNLRNSDEGDEPFLLEEEFSGKDDWKTLPTKFIDQAPDGFASALSFFSREAFRFYLPAYLLADLRGELLYSDPLFHLTFGLTDKTKDVLVNPHRYGSLTWYEYESDRFSVFTAQEVDVIVAYLKVKMRQADLEYQREEIAQALRNYWEQAAFIKDG